MLRLLQCRYFCGTSISLVGAPVPSNYNYFRWADQLDTGNVLVKRNVFKFAVFLIDNLKECEWGMVSLVQEHIKKA